jgi:murein DD-endopeptidase MepM/ murein hydrolase activator NlpD
MKTYKEGKAVSKMKKIVTSALVITGATALSSMEVEAEEQSQAGWIDEEIQWLELEIIEKALRSYTNPLNRISAEISQMDKKDRVTYEIKSGDTLSGIAQKFGITVAEITQENGIENSHRISIGQKLRIRLKENKYVVKYGDTLKDIAEAKGISMEEIVSYNWVLKNKNYTVLPGQEIKIPTAPPEPAHQPVITPRQNAPKKNKVVIASRSEETTTKLGNFSWPVTGMLSSRFGMRWGRPHNGIDIANSGKSNTPITAAMSGVVSDAYFDRSGYGNLVIIDHGDGVQTYYAHLSKITVKEGEKINQGDMLGYMGSTGNSTGYHLHFEIRKNNRPLNPLKYLP